MQATTGPRHSAAPLFVQPGKQTVTACTHDPNKHPCRYGKDFPIYPFLPTSWAGAGAAGKNESIYGANVTVNPENTTGQATVASLNVFSGPRTVQPVATQFLFDMLITPSHPLDLASHWNSRYLQIGYGGVNYQTPEAVRRFALLAVCAVSNAFIPSPADRNVQRSDTDHLLTPGAQPIFLKGRSHSCDVTPRNWRHPQRHNGQSVH